MRGFLRVLWTGLLLVTVALVSALVTMRLAIHGREVDVPDVRGRTPAEARRMAEDLGLEMLVDRRFYSASVPEGRILSQIPTPGSAVRRGWELRLAVSLGPQRVTIPPVVGQSQRAATIVLQQRGLEGSVSEIAVPNSPAGQVLAQNPTANAADVATPRVSLLVALDASHGAFVMPSLIGRPLGSATLAIQDAGFSIGKVTVATALPPTSSTSTVATLPRAAIPSQSARYSNGAGSIPSPAAIIVSQVPAPGQKIEAGSEIRLVVR